MDPDVDRWLDEAEPAEAAVVRLAWPLLTQDERDRVYCDLARDDVHLAVDMAIFRLNSRRVRLADSVRAALSSVYDVGAPVIQRVRQRLVENAEF